MSDEPNPSIAQQTTDLGAYKLGKALWDGAKQKSRAHTSSFAEDQKFALGETQYPVPTSYRAGKRSQWKNQSVRNYTFATINHKMAVILDAEPNVIAEPLNETVTSEDRDKIATVVKQIMENLNFADLREDVVLDSSVCGKGIAHWFPVLDEFTGMYSIQGELVDGNRFYPDPSRTRIKQCRYVVYEPELDMSDARRIFPKTYQLIKPTTKQIGTLGEVGHSRSTEEIIYGPSTGEIVITRDGAIQERKADVAFVWIGDPEVARDLKTVLERAPQVGFKCQNCGEMFGKGNADTDPLNPASPTCPYCSNNALEPTMLPPVFVQEEERSRKYPYGRLIALCESGLLYDGPSDYKLRAPHFPFSENTWYRVNRRFWSAGDVAMLKTVQQALNKNISQAIDNLRMNGNAPLEFPAEVPIYKSLGTQPGDAIPCPAAFMGMARYLPTNSYNVQLHQILDQALKSDMQEVSGVSDVARGITPSAPTSGKEVEVRESFATKRLGLHRKNTNEFESDSYDIVWQLANQFMVEPRAFRGRKPTGEIYFITETVASLPRDVAIRVTADVDKVQKDNLLGQNILGFVQNGGLDSPYADLMLKLIAKGDRGIVREFEERRSQLQEQAALAEEAQAQAAAPLSAAGEAPQTPPTGPPPQEVPPEMMMAGVGG